MFRNGVLGKALLLGVFGSATGVGVSTYYTYDMLTNAQQQIRDLHSQVSRQEVCFCLRPFLIPPVFNVYCLQSSCPTQTLEKQKIDELLQLQKREDRGLTSLANEIAQVKSDLETSYRKKVNRIHS